MEPTTNYSANVDKISFCHHPTADLPHSWWLQNTLDLLGSSRKVEDYKATVDEELSTVYTYIHPEK